VADEGKPAWCNPAAGFPLLLAGVRCFPTTRKLPVPKAPSITHTVTPERLVEQLNQRWDAVVRGVEPDELYSVTADSETIEDPAKKHLLITPEYVLNIMRQRPGSKQLTPVRVVTFDRDDLLPYQQDVYDSDGNLETQVFYAGYRDFGGVKYPSIITIKRPLEASQLILSVQTVNQNQTLKDDQFQVAIPPGTEIKNLD
jgi:hypothetical protein